MEPRNYLTLIKSHYLEKGDALIAKGQKRYMRQQFEYYGLKAPVWQGIVKVLFKEHGLLTGETLQHFVRLCMEDEYREVHYAGLEMLQKQMKKSPESFIDFYEELLQKNAWWDTVDWIRKFVGIHFQRFPHLIIPTTEKWMASNDRWLQRICLIFQLTYKEDTDFELMKKYILALSDSNEFFIQKGAGWALRQYSRSNPAGVIEFIEQHPQLKPLTKREGLRILKKQGLYW